MNIKKFVREMVKEAKKADEGVTSKWIRSNPNASRLLMSPPVAGAISARPGERAKSFGKGLGASLVGSYGGMAAGAAGGAGLGALASKILSKGVKKAAILGALMGSQAGALAGYMYGGVPLSRKWQKKYEKTGPTK